MSAAKVNKMFAQALRHTPRHRVKRRAKELSSIERWNERIKMKSHVKYLCLAMALCLALGFASVAGASLSDVGDHWAKAGIEKWVDSGLAKGYPDGTFKPDNNITRAEFVALMNRAFDVPKKDAVAGFADVNAADWYYADVCAAANGGYVTGYEDNTFRPNNAITRAEAAAIVARLLKLPAGDLGALDKFSDAAAISDWAAGSVAAMVKANLLSGYPDGTFGPAKLITRAESIVTLDRAVNYAGIEIPEIADVSVEGVSLNMTSLSLKVGDTSQLTATIKPKNASVKTVSWESSNDKVATVDSSGKVIAVATGSATITVTTKEGGKTASCSVTVTQYSSSGGGGSGPVTPTKSVSVSLADTASGIGQVATVTLTGYTDAASYRLLKSDGAPLTEKINVGKKVVVMFFKPGDTCKVEVYDAAGVLLDTKTVKATTIPVASATVTLTGAAAGFGNVATVTLTGYPGAASYRLLKADGTALTGKIDVGKKVTVLFLNKGDVCKVEVYDAAGILLDTKTVEAS
ncbi:MAG: S-layer homology domain-containing protein [Firmicutes bacterium]|nr:S-layer homology domain-containing protein [Bacillota bacterium]